MAVGFDATTGEYWQRTTDLLDYNGNYTFTLWFNGVWPTAGNYKTYLNLAIPTSNNGDVFQIKKAGANNRFSIYVANIPGGITDTSSTDAFSENVWYYLSGRRSSTTSVELFVNNSLTVTNTRSVVGRSAIETMDFARVNINSFIGEYIDANFFALKIWSTSLTTSQIANEMYSIAPKFTDQLYAWYPIFPGGGRTRDYSHNGRGWTETGTPPDTTPPPIGWGQNYYILSPFVVAPTTVQKTHILDATLKAEGTARTHILDAVLEAGVVTNSETFVLQTVLKSAETKTHLLDANLKSVGVTRSHAIQSILKKTNTATFNLQAILAKSLTVDHVYDATLKKTVSTSYSLSATLKQESASVDHILSAILKGEAGTKDHILQSFLTAAVTKTFVLDATLSSAGVARTFNLQSKLSVTQTASHLLDAILKETGNKTFVVSAVLKESKTVTHILAAGIKGTNTQAYVYGGTLKAEQTSRTFTLGGTLKETVSKTHIIQAQLARIVTATHSLDANLKGQGQSVDYTLSAVLKAEAGSATHILQSFLSTIKTNTHTLDANLQKTTTLDYALGAALKQQFDKSFDLISILRKTGTDTHSLQAGLKETISKDFSLDAILGSQSVDRSFNLQTRLKVEGNTLTHILQANITSSKQVSYILQSVLFNVPGEPVRVFLLGEIIETNLQAGNINNIIDLEGEV